MNRRQSEPGITLTVGTPVGDLQRVIRFEANTRTPVWYLTCPACGLRAEIDLDQFYGTVSIQCEEPCSFHETVDLHYILDGELMTLVHALRDERQDHASGPSEG